MPHGVDHSPLVAAPVGVSVPLADALKARTQPLHTAAERHPFQAAIMMGRATREDYQRYLAQMLLVHSTLEPALKTLADKPGPFADLVRDHHFRTRALADDLRTLDAASHLPRALPATEAFCREIAGNFASNPQKLLGVLYVLEGATNGGVYIAKAVRKSLALPEGEGTRYLEPHGAQQRERWQEFRATLNGLTGIDHEQVIEGASGTFQAICNIFDDLQGLAALAR